MSKKIMKRSLALGALMAFVITGSAWAGTLDGKNYYLSGANENVAGNAMQTPPDYILNGAERVIGGWSTVDGSVTILNSNFQVTGGSFGMVVGGNYTGSSHNMTVASTNIVIDGATVKQVIGGTGFNSVDGNDNTAGRSTNVTILSGSFGGVIDNTDCPEMHVVAGDLLKSFGYSPTNHNINTTIDNTNLTIEDGTFNAAVYGGSAATRMYAGCAGNELKAVVNNASISISGGTFNDAIVAGGLAWGHVTNSIVKNATVDITGGIFNNGADIYAGGLDGSNGAGYETAISNVENAKINISDVTVNNIYGTGGNISFTAAGDPYPGGGNERDWEYKQNTDADAVVNTDLSLSNVNANTIDLPEGTLTLVGTNNVKNITIGADVTKVEIASKALNEGSSLTGDGNGSLIVEGEKTTKLTITGITAGTYNIAGGYKINQADKLLFDQTDSLLNAEASMGDDGIYKVVVTAKDTGVISEQLGVSENTAGLVETVINNAGSAETPAEQAAVEFIEKAIASENAGETINAATKMGEAGGNSATAASIVKNVTGVTNDRLSFNCGHSAPHKGGHGVGLFEEGSGADIWVEYVHGKDEVEDMPSTAGATSYEGQYNGIVMGVDFKKVNKFQSGIAFNYGEGDTNSLGSSVRTHSDYDFWGVGYYGNIHNDDSNVIFDINYAKTDSDVTQSSDAGTLEASPETTTWSAGVKLEKLYQNENVQIVPYTGLRYMSIDADDYSTKKGEFYYSMDRQDIWLLPLGVSIRQEIANDNGWTVSPRVDLSYIWAFGDTNSNMEVKTPFAGVSQLGYDVMDDGSFLGLVGIEAHKGQWGYGVAYSYQKGDHSESKKWFVDVNYSF